MKNEAGVEMTMKSRFYVVLAAVGLFMLTGCGLIWPDVKYDHVVIVGCDGRGMDLRLNDGTIKHYDVWNFSMPSCSLIPQNVDVSLALKNSASVTNTYSFGWVRKNEVSR